MKALSSRVTKGLVPTSTITCADNSGAHTLMMIGVIGRSAARKGRMPAAGIGDVIIASVKTGTPQMVKKKVRAVIIRQKQTIRRANGLRVKFEDNAGVLVTDADIAVGTEIKGAMAREVVERYIKLAGIASRVI